MSNHALEPQSIETALAKLLARTQVKHAGELRATTARVQQDLRLANDKLVISNRELEIANADLESFSYSVAHDLRSPIRQIAGFSKILQEEYAAQLPAEASRYLQKVAEGAQQMGRLVDDLLHLAQVSRQTLSLQLNSLNSIVSAAIELLKPECAGRIIEWRIDDLGSVQCDQGLIQQAFVNLLSNAIKYTRPRNPAVISIGQIVGDGERVIFINDNGVGFDMKYADKLFGVFQRLHTDNEFEGTGVGLATVERILRKHGGRIWVEAELNRGATFSFTVQPRSI